MQPILIILVDQSICDLSALVTQLSNLPFESCIMTYILNHFFDMTYCSQLYNGKILYRWNLSVVSEIAAIWEFFLSQVHYRKGSSLTFFFPTQKSL